MEYIGFADANEFVKVSGISKNDLENTFIQIKSFNNLVCIDLERITNVTSKLDQQLILLNKIY